MKRLILIRHAKSSWDAPLDDHARPLNARGRRDATRLGLWLGAQGYVPDRVYSSDAERTRETTQHLLDAFDAGPQTTFSPALYHASANTLFRAMTGAEGDTIALVAHNPGIAAFAERVVATNPDHDRFWDYPTAATLICDFAINTWAEAVPHSGQVVAFVTPQDLSD